MQVASCTHSTIGAIGRGNVLVNDVSKKIISDFYLEIEEKTSIFHLF